MVTTSQSHTPTPTPPQSTGGQLEGDAEGEKGFFGLLVQSIFEPGANAAVILAMNICFFLLLNVLFVLAFLTGWNWHVLMLMGVTALLWGSMLWFVLEITKVQIRPDNQPPTTDMLDQLPPDQPAPVESRKDR